MKITGYSDIQYEPGEIIHPEIGEIGAWKTSGGSPIPKGALVEIWASSGAVHLAQSPLKLPVGVALNDTQYGEECRVLLYGISTVITDGDTTPGMMLVSSPDNSGYVHPILNTDEETRVIGIALSAAKTGQPVVMALKSWGGL